jgi:hypothetical protein
VNDAARALRAYPPGILTRGARRRPAFTLADLFIAEYPDPRPCDSLEQFERAHHMDIAALSLDEIDRERVRALNRWAYDSNPSEWLLERRRLLDDTAARLRQRKPAR